MKRIIYSIVFSFLSVSLWALDAPNPTAPADGITNAYTRQKFTWTAVDNAGSYELEMDTTKAFDSPLLVKKTFSSTTNQYVYHLHYNTHYYWRMRSVSKTDASVKSEWCSLRELTTLSQVTLWSPNNPDGDSFYYPKQDFCWKNSYGSVRYVLEIDTTDRFDSSVKRRVEYSSYYDNTTEKLTKTVDDLYMKCTTYWRVKAYNNSDSSAWSEVYRFHMIQRAKATSPDGYENALTKQTLYWSYQRGLNKVIIELDTTSAFNSPAKRIISSGGSSADYCNTSVENLYFGKDYYWRIKAYHSKDTTDWSDVLHFKTYNHCNLSSPADSSTGLSTQVSLYYSYVSDISKYQVQLDTTPTFSSSHLQTRMSSASSSDYAYETFSELLFGQNYYWRVRRCHSKDTSNWSETRLFTTAKACPLTQSPDDSATEVSTSPYLYFNTVKGISYYQQQIDTTPLFNSPVMESKIETCSSSSSYNYTCFEDLYFGTTYYRRTRRCHSKDTSDWSVTRCFTTIVRGAYSNNSSYPSIAKGATGQSVTPKLYYFYRSYIDSVEIQIDTTLNFDSPLFESIRVKEAGSQSSAYEVPKNKLLYGTTYYWRIRNSHSKDVSDWTFPRYFTTVSELPQPILIAPSNQSSVRIDSVVFAWHACRHSNGDAQRYVLQLSHDVDFGSIYRQVVLEDTTTWLALDNDSSLYWRVRGENSRGNSPWSEVRGLNPAWSLSTPVLITPADEAKTYTRVPFRWRAVENADGYVLEISHSPLFDVSASKQDSFCITDTGFVVHSFHYGNDLYWHVRAVNKAENLISKWSETRMFLTSDTVRLTYDNDDNPTAKYFASQTLTWNNHPGSTSYILEIDTTADFSSSGLRSWSVEGSTSTSDSETITQQVSQLYLGCFNYWRVAAVNNRDTSSWGQVRRFHTFGKAVARIPSDSLVNAYTIQNFGWEYKRGLDSALVQLDTVPSFSSPALRTVKSWAYNQDDASVEINNLYFGTRYYWRVANFHKRDTTDWSDTRTFVTYNFCKLSYPSDSATNQYTTRELSFVYHKGVYGYTIEVDTTADFDSPMFARYYQKAYGEDWASYTLYNLHFGTTYYWRVKENNHADTTVWSPTRCFTTYDFCTLTSPSNGSERMGTSPTLKWEYSKGVSNYQVQADTTMAFNSPLLINEISSASSQDYCYHNLHDLRFGTTYYWRVRECHKNDTSRWSSVWHFTTYDYGVMKSPVNGATNISTLPKLTFEYSSWLQAYMLQIDTTSGFDSDLLREKTTTASSQTYAYWQLESDLLYGTTYYWRVRDVNRKDTTEWASPWFFTTAYQMSQPVLLLPVDSAMYRNDETVNFAWLSCEGATQYVYQLSDDPQFTTYLHQEIIADTLTTLVPPFDSRTYWRVQAVNSKGRSPWSEVRTLQTSSVVPTELDNMRSADGRTVQKVLYNGRIFIIKEGKMYDIRGVEAR